MIITAFDDTPAQGSGGAGWIPAGAFDEMVTGDGRVRSHWRDFLGALATLRDGRLSDRIGLLRRQLADDGVLHTVYGDSRGRRQGWEVDPAPFLIEPAAWAVLEAGMIQRARLLDRVLDDIYGGRRLLAAGEIPPDLVLRNPDYLRPCGGARPGGALHLYAADLVRGPDGAWRVVSDRTQSPSGIGYVLANRRLSERILSDLLGLLPVRSPRPFLAQMDEVMRRLTAALPATRRAGPPRVVVLTPGTGSPDHVEHVYVAREIGALLAEGADLTVRDRTLYFKTLAGLERVDVLIRRVDGRDCDPLEASPRSMLGVPGLMQAWRAGTVGVLNGFGTGVVEDPALAPLWPALAGRLLGQKLLLPSVETLWDPPPDAAAALEIRTMAAAGLGPPQPWDRVARHGLVPSLTPRWTESGIEPTPTVLRLFAVGAGGAWHVLPGGLARTVVSHDPFFTPLGGSAGFRDVWVLSDRRHTMAAPLPEIGAEPRLRRGAGSLPSRAADDLFWLGRTVERIETQLRLVRATIWRLTETGPDQRVFAELRLLALCLAQFGLLPIETAAAGADSTALRQAVLRILAAGGPLTEQLATLDRLVDGNRDRLSADMWEALERLAEHRGGLDGTGGAEGGTGALLATIDRILRGCAGIAGLAWENMTRGLAWRFLDAGRRIERGAAAAGILSRLLGEQGGEPALRLMLELFDSTITYRLRYLAAVRFGPVLDLVLLDDSNPRAIAFQLRTLEDHLAALPPRPGPEIAFGGAAALDAVASALRGVEAGGRTSIALPAMASLPPLVGRIAGELNALSNALTAAYFSHVRPVRPLGVEFTK